MIKLVNIFFPLWDFLYILQLEEYEIKRYLKQVQLRLFKRGFQQRDRLRYTGRIKLTIILLIAVLASLILELMQMQLYVYAIAVIATLPFTTPYLIAVTSAVVGAVASLQKQRQLTKAKKYFENNYPNTKVIAITGSFGKTTAKYMLEHVLQYDYRVAIVPDNINTAIGVAHHILADKVPTNTDLLIVEMGAYTRGDISQTATVVKPDLAVLTILGDQHLERFGSHDDLVHGKSEIFTTNGKTKCYVTPDSISKIKEQQINTTQLVSVEVPSGSKSTQYLVRQLALDLGVSNESVDASIESFIPPDRRNNIIERQGVTIVDNSYNISPMVAEAMITEAAETAKKQNKRLVVMTGGIGEQGVFTEKVNRELGQLLNTYATRAIVNSTVYTKYIEQELTIPFTVAPYRTEVTDNPKEHLDGKTELLLWLTGHGDLAYV